MAQPTEGVALFLRNSAIETTAGRASATIGQIPEREGLSTEYVGKVMGVLSRANLAESVRGRNGGYRLARDPGSICVSEALAALGGKLYRPAETCDRFSGDHSFCVHSTTCSIRSLWSGLQLMIDSVLSRTTLQDLVATNETNMGAWMRAQFEALAQLVGRETPQSSVGPGNVTLVTPDGKVEPDGGTQSVETTRQLSVTVGDE